jgi:CHAT domain-containing protein
MRAQLPAGAALVSFVRHEDSYRWPGAPAQRVGSRWRYGAFVARAEGEVRFLPLGEASRAESLVAVLRAAAEAPPSAESERSYRRAAGALRRQVWDPLAASLAGAGTVFLVPDGALQLVSFAALPTARDRYLVETGPELVTLSTERDLLAALESRPLYRGSHSECPDFSSLRLAALPATAREAGAVSALWRSQRARATASDTSVQALLGSHASEDRFKRLAPTCRVLHVATHGFFVRPECETHADFADRPERYVQSHENALLRSGLALAGFNAREHARPIPRTGCSPPRRSRRST